MKIRAVANGNVIDVTEGEAKALLAAGIYEAVDEKKAKPSPTAVSPLTTSHIPQPQKRRK